MLLVNTILELVVSNLFPTTRKNPAKKLLGLFLGRGGGGGVGGAYYWKEFCISKWVALDNKNSLKH